MSFQWVTDSDAPNIQDDEDWEPFPGEYFDAAICGRKFEDALKHLKETPFDKVKEYLQQHQIHGLPAWHHIARLLRLKEEDKEPLRKILQYYIRCGYDINQRTDSYRALKRASNGFTALFAAVERTNGVLLDILLEPEFGVDINVRDKGGYSACHWAILVGDSRNLKKLINAGANVISTEKEKSGEDNVHPILHTAVDEGRSDIVFYLATEKVVDINEEATYRSIMTELSLSSFPSRYNCEGTTTGRDEEKLVELEDIPFTPLGRAVRMRKIPIIELFLKVGVQSSLRDLHFCIMEGDSEVACLLMLNFSEQQLAIDQIGESWALHCLHQLAFVSSDETRIEKTKQLIKEYVECGWDVNATSESLAWRVAESPIPYTRVIRSHVILANCSLLHLACLHNSSNIVSFLIGIGANLNVPLEIIGELEITPLQICILNKNWKTARELVYRGADVVALGCLKSCRLTNMILPTRINPKWKSGGVLASPGSDSSTFAGQMYFNAVELLLKFGEEESEELLDLMLSKADIGENELLMSFESGNPKFVLKILKKLDQELTYKLPRNVYFHIHKDRYPHYDREPTFSYVLGSLKTEFSDVQNQMAALANVMEVFAKHGYDFNRDVVCNATKECSMMRHLFLFDFKFKTHCLLPTILKFDHVKINPKSSHSRCSIVETVLNTWNEQCTADSNFCWNHHDEANYCTKVVGLLLERGVDVSSLVINGRNHKYHSGYKDMLKALVYMGATICPSFFEDAVCHVGYTGETKGFLEEIAELQNWVNGFELAMAKPTLKDICRMKVRRNIRIVGDLRMLEQLPSILKNAILGINLIL